MAETPDIKGTADVPKNRENVPLALPSVFRFILRQLELVGYSLLINGLAAALAILFYATPSALGSLESFAKSLLSGTGLENNLGVVVFGVFASFAAIVNAIGPIHIAHDRAIRFLHNIELSKQLSREIALATYASDRPERKQWAYDIAKRYRPKRRVGKVALGIMLILMVATMITPWLLVLRELHWMRTEIIIVTALLAPIIFGHASEVTAMIWPGKVGFRLGEGRVTTT